MQFQPFTAQTHPVLRLFLADAIDYAGLFPPANLAMEQVVRHYHAYCVSEDRWALGRLVVPANRLGELVRVTDAAEIKPGVLWRISALLGPDPIADMERIEKFNAVNGARFCVDSCEGRFSDSATISTIADRCSGSIALYCEIPQDGDLESLIAAIGAAGVRTKIRMGGVTPDMFPGPEAVLRFLNTTIAAGVPFKATAGLHHPFRSAYPLTYEPHAPRAPMYGFLNLLFATAAILSGAGNETAMGVLLEENPLAVRFSEDGVEWEGKHIPANQLGRFREMFYGFGSCSFREPVDDLRAIGLLS